MRSPKLVYPKTGKCTWYPYYAGYSRQFVQDALMKFALQAGDVVLDPWNGSGTTTEVSRGLGLRAIGIDVNPAMIIVGKARLLDPLVCPSLVTICQDIVNKCFKSKKRIFVQNDPLASWFGAESVTSIRRLDHVLQQLLIDADDVGLLKRFEPFSKVSTLAAFYYVALFRTLRELLQKFYSSNPTWIKTPSSGNCKLRPSQATILSLFQHHVETMMYEFTVSDTLVSNTYETTIELASSIDLPISDLSVSAVVTSPPYCTRIDYAVATLPELALIGYSAEDVRSLRESLIGSPTIWKSIPSINSCWGKTCTEFLENVAIHPSRASSTYYLKTFLQYFSSMYKSMREIDRTVKASGDIAIVVQESYYKELRNDLAGILSEMADSFDWKLSERLDFATQHPMVCRNSKAKKYRQDLSLTESVLIFKKPPYHVSHRDGVICHAGS